MRVHEFTLHVTAQGSVVEIDDRYIGHELMKQVRDIVGPIDDAGCDWITDNQGNTYIAFAENYQVSDKPGIATLVNAANYVRYGHFLTTENHP